MPDAQILLFGDDDGIEDAAEELGTELISIESKTEYNTPFLDSAFRIAHDRAEFDLICYINTDIILLQDFFQSVNLIHYKRFLMIGCRYDIDLNREVFIDRTTEKFFRNHAFRRWESDNSYGSDFFLFTKSSGFREILNFIVGRPGWDNWIIFRGRMLRIPVIDVSESVFCVHQNHDYQHVPERTGEKWEGVEGDHNLNLLLKGQRMSLIDASHKMKDGKIRLNFSKKHRIRYLSTLQITHPELLPLFRLFWFAGKTKHNLFRLLRKQS